MARFYRKKKIYGEYKTDNCYFCGKIATATNKSGVLTCRHHTETQMEEIKCVCGTWLEARSGKFGPYFNCLNCGNINFKKGLEMKSMMSAEDKRKAGTHLSDQKVSTEQSRAEARERRQETNKNRLPGKRVIEISTDDWEYFN